MTAGPQPDGRAAFLAVSSIGVDAEPRAVDRIADLGSVIVYLSDGARLHMFGAAQARAFADAFTKAARLLDDAPPAASTP